MVVDSPVDKAMNRDRLLDQLVHLISTVASSHPLRVAVDGLDAAGKTTLAEELASKLSGKGRDVIQSSIDGFHNPRSIRYRRGAMSPEGYFHDSFDYQFIASRLLIPLGRDGDRCYRTAVFDYGTDRVVEAPVLKAPDDAILVFDGIFLQRPELARYWDVSIFVDVTVDTVLERAESRFLSRNGRDPESADVTDLRKRYQLRYIPGQQEYLRSCHPEEKADIVIDNNDLSKPTISHNRL
jgi:uridine kinase